MLFNYCIPGIFNSPDYKPKVLRLASDTAVKEECAFKRHGIIESGFNLFTLLDYYQSMQLPEVWKRHTEEFEKLYGYAKDEQGKKIEPKTWSRWKIPGIAQDPSADENAAKKVPIWGRICDQYDWPDLEAWGPGTQFTCFTGTKVQILTLKALPGYASNYYKGALRHENMSWFWIRFSV